jgi:hypothetical protein
LTIYTTAPGKHYKLSKIIYGLYLKCHSEEYIRYAQYKLRDEESRPLGRKRDPSLRSG